MQKELANMVVQGVSTDETWDKLPTDMHEQALWFVVLYIFILIGCIPINDALFLLQLVPQ